MDLSNFKLHFLTLNFSYLLILTLHWRLKGAPPEHDPLWPIIASISCSFLEILQNSMVVPPEGLAPIPGAILDLPLVKKTEMT